MKIKSVKINKYRSIHEAVFEVNDFNVFVGQNNHGKTNIFEALDRFFGKKENIEEVRFCREGTDPIQVILTLTGLQEGIERMANEKQKTALRNIFGAGDEITVCRDSNLENGTKRHLRNSKNSQRENPMGTDPARDGLLPRFEYVTTKQYHTDVAKYGSKTPIGVMLGGVLATILEGNQQYIEFQQKFSELFDADESPIRIEFDQLGNKVKAYLEKQFPDCTKVKFEVIPPIFEDLLKNFETSLDDGIETNAKEKGDGMQRALMLSIIQAYAEHRRENEKLNRPFLFFIDEAELHLHPTAQRNLKNVLLELSRGRDQVFINTHSSVLVTDDNACQAVFKVEKKEKKTNVILVDNESKPYIIYDLLGGSPADLLLPHNFIIVEGRSDQAFLQSVINRFFKHLNKHIHIVVAGGDIEQQERDINALTKTIRPLYEGNPIYKDRLVVLCDATNSGNQKQFDDFKLNHESLFDNKQIFQLNTLTLEEYYPSTRSKEAEDVLKIKDHRGLAKIKLAEIVSQSITEKSLKDDMPILYNALDTCFKKSF